jgi:hypothetical protein
LSNPETHTCNDCGHNCVGRLKDQLNQALLERDNARVLYSLERTTCKLADKVIAELQKELKEAEKARVLMADTILKVTAERDAALEKLKEVTDECFWGDLKA